MGRGAPIQLPDSTAGCNRLQPAYINGLQGQHRPQIQEAEEMTTTNLRRTPSGKTTFAKVGIWKDERTGKFNLTFPEAEKFPVSVSQDEHPKLYERLEETVRRAVQE
jgi:hypothetical protein